MDLERSGAAQSGPLRLLLEVHPHMAESADPLL